MNINKHLEFMNPLDYSRPIHVIGVGAVGGFIVEQLVRLGFENINIYDIDTVDDINIANQIYTHNDIGKLKVDAIEERLLAINPLVKIRKSGIKGYTGQPLSGAVFLAVDSIDLRRKIAKGNQFNSGIDVMFDGRMRLTDAQQYGADWNNDIQKEAFIASMNFSDEEAAAATPVSACNTTLSVVPTVVVLASVVVANFINFIKGTKVSNMSFIDPFEGILDFNKY